MYADQDYAAGEEVFISYGILPNADLLLTCAPLPACAASVTARAPHSCGGRWFTDGFVLPDNIFESVGFGLGLSDTDPSHDVKVRRRLGDQLPATHSLWRYAVGQRELLQRHRLVEHMQTHVSLEGRPRCGLAAAVWPRGLLTRRTVPSLCRPCASRSMCQRARSRAAAAVLSSCP